MYPFTRIFLLSLLVAFSGCGESFRGQQNSSEEVSGSFTSDGFRRSETQVGVDYDIYLSYENELRGKQTQTLTLSRTIQAFDFFVSPGASADQVELNALITLNCEDSKEFSRSILSSDLQAGRRIHLGTVEGYSVRIQCTDPSCNELVAGVSSAALEATVLTGLSVTAPINNNLVFMSRRVDISPYFVTFISGSIYRERNSCPDDLSDGSLLDRIEDLARQEINDFLIEESRDWLQDLLDRL